MNKTLLGSVATGALVVAGSANAADLNVRKAPGFAPIPAFSWTGCFVGGHAGWGWGKKDVRETNVFVSSNGSTFISERSAGIDTEGIIAGGQIGCDYQWSGNWVIGIQGDLAGSSIGGGDQTLTDVFGNTNFTHFTVDTEWLASITGRFGYAWTPQTLIYIRGGVAWVREKWNFTSRHNSGVNLRDDEFSTSAKQTRTGWTIGGGIEYAFARNWTVFGEFNHYDFGRKDTATASASSGGCTSTTTFNTRQRIETVKGGVNYRFY